MVVTSKPTEASWEHSTLYFCKNPPRKYIQLSVCMGMQIGYACLRDCVYMWGFMCVKVCLYVTLILSVLIKGKEWISNFIKKSPACKFLNIANALAHQHRGSDNYVWTLEYFRLISYILNQAYILYFLSRIRLKNTNLIRLTRLIFDSCSNSYKKSVVEIM